MAARDAVLKHVAANVRRIRREHGLSQEALAERTELALTTVQRIERAELNATVTVVASIAEALEIEVGELFKPAKLRPIRRGRPRPGG